MTEGKDTVFPAQTLDDIQVVNRSRVGRTLHSDTAEQRQVTPVAGR